MDEKKTNKGYVIDIPADRVLTIDEYNEMLVSKIVDMIPDNTLIRSEMKPNLYSRIMDTLNSENKNETINPEIDSLEIVDILQAFDPRTCSTNFKARLSNNKIVDLLLVKDPEKGNQVCWIEECPNGNKIPHHAYSTNPDISAMLRDIIGI